MMMYLQPNLEPSSPTKKITVSIHVVRLQFLKLEWVQ